MFAAEALFWAHIILIIFAILSGFFLPLWIVLVFIVLHKLHLVILGNCIFTILKRMIGVHAANEDFLQYASRRFSGSNISKRASSNINYGIYALATLISIIANNLIF
jgi:hypothetical protein